MADESGTNKLELDGLEDAAQRLLRSKDRKVLLIEDTAAHAAIIRRALSPQWEVSHVTRASAALDEFQADPNLIVLLDLSLPDSDGFQVLTRLHRINAAAPVIVVTALEQVSASVEAMKRGAWNYVVKSDPKETEDRIREAVQHAWTKRQVAAQEYLIEQTRIVEMVRNERLHAIELIVRTVCHEVNNPLSGVVALSQLLSQHDKAKLDDDLKRLAGGILQSAQEVARVVQKLRSVGDQETEFGGQKIIDIRADEKLTP
jgi:DNA-binding response OmpR family regulator